MTLTEWRRLSFQLAADLEALRREAERCGLDGLAAEAAALRARVEERRFTVAVVGDFRRGKSTFINALLGRAVLPSDVAPTTATVNRVTWGTRPSAELRFHDGRPPEVVPVETLADHVTKLSGESAARAAAIREAVVTWPVSFCRNDVDLLDTPGLGDEATMTAVTMRQLPQVDAAILVVMADSPFSETEGDFLDRLYAEGVTELLFVVSALDRIRRPSDRERVLVAIRDRIAARIRRIADARYPAGSPEHAEFLRRRGQPRVFGVSALQALEAREGGGVEDAEAVEASGMPAFEDALATFLTQADEAGMRRRFEQAEALCRQFAVPAVAIAADGIAERELARAEALVHALDAVVDDHNRRVSDACARVLAGSGDLVERYTTQVIQRVTADVQQADVTPHFPARWPSFLDEKATALAQSVGAIGRWLAGEIDRRLRDELGDPAADERRMLSTFGLVFGHVEATLRRLGHPVHPPLWRAPEAGPAPGLDIEGLAAALTPPVAALREALHDPTAEGALAQIGRRNTFEALISLDFTGPQGRWAAQVAPRVVAACQASWSRTAPAAAVRQLVEAMARRRLGLDAIGRAKRTALADVVACRERATLGRERQAHDRQASVRHAQQLAEGLRRVAAELAAR